MRFAIIAFIAAVLTFSFAVPEGAAQAKDGSYVKKARKKIKKFDFRPDDIEGTGVRPGGSDINTRQFVTHESLIRIRQDFMKEIMKETENI